MTEEHLGQKTNRDASAAPSKPIGKLSGVTVLSTFLFVLGITVAVGMGYACDKWIPADWDQEMIQSVLWLFSGFFFFMSVGLYVLANWVRRALVAVALLLLAGYGWIFLLAILDMRYLAVTLWGVLLVALFPVALILMTCVMYLTRPKVAAAFDPGAVLRAAEAERKRKAEDAKGVIIKDQF